MKKEIKIIKNGPYEVSGLSLSEGIIKTDGKGYPLTVEKTKDYSIGKVYYLYRCGKSSFKPFCDATHRYINFKD